MHRRAWSTCRRQLQRRARQYSTAAETVQITTLPNKLRVATETTPGHFSTVGLYIDAGARYEDAYNSGVSHFLDRMAFKVCFYVEHCIAYTHIVHDRAPALGQMTK